MKLGMNKNNQEREHLLLVMYKMLCWNVRGSNNTKKQFYVKHYIHKLSISIVSLSETKVRTTNLGSLYQRLYSGWCFTTNSNYHNRGRIILGGRQEVFRKIFRKVLVSCFIV